MNLSSFLHIVKWFQVFLCNSNNLTSVICFHSYFKDIYTCYTEGLSQEDLLTERKIIKIEIINLSLIGIILR